MTNFLIELLAWTLNAIIAGYIAIWFYKRRQRKNEEMFLKELIIQYPDHPAMYYYSIRAVDEEALKDLQKQVRANALVKMEESRPEDIPPPPPPPPRRIC